MKIRHILQDSPNKKILMTGNEAIARGILEAGVKLILDYSDFHLGENGVKKLIKILKNLSEFSNSFTLYQNFDEKVVIESYIETSLTGIRSLVISSDPESYSLNKLSHLKFKKGALIFCSKYPIPFSSKNMFPIIEPSTIQECKVFIKEGLILSEFLKTPVYIYAPPQLLNGYGIVECEEIHFREKGKKNSQFTDYKEILLNSAKKLLTMNDSTLSENIGVITRGIGYSYVIQACRKLEISPPILKLGLIFPINRDEIYEFSNQHGLNKLLVVEESEYLTKIFLLENIEISGAIFKEVSTAEVMKFFSGFFIIRNNVILEEIYRNEIIRNELIPSLAIRETSSDKKFTRG